MPIELTTPKFNKERCLSCRYSGRGNGGYVANGKQVYCDYANIAEHTCLTRGPKGKVIDRRGTDYNNYLLYAPGKVNKTKQLIVGGNYERRG